jgi:hypothetical protein
MKQPFDDLSKDLASGMSRREALQRFIGGLGVAFLALFTGRCEGNAVCVQACRAQGLSGNEFGACVSASTRCPRGQCAYRTNNGQFVCMAV